MADFLVAVSVILMPVSLGLLVAGLASWHWKRESGEIEYLPLGCPLNICDGSGELPDYDLSDGRQDGVRPCPHTSSL